MQALRLPARRGWSWIQGGFDLLKRNPPLLIAVTMTYLLSVLLLNLVPVVGPIVLGVSLPSLSVVVANTFRGVDRFHGMNLDVMRLGIRRNARGLFRLGLVHLGVSLVVIVVGTTLFGVELAPTGPGEEAMAANMLRLLPMLIIVMLLRPRGLWPSPEHGKVKTEPADRITPLSGQQNPPGVDFPGDAVPGNTPHRQYPVNP